MFRIGAALLVPIWLVVSSCSNSDNCVSVGKNLIENRELVADLANRQGLPTTDLEAANIVGAAWAFAMLEGGQEGVPVVVCLRQGDGDDTEFRILSMAGKVLDEWRSLAELLSNTPRRIDQVRGTVRQSSQSNAIVSFWPNPAG
jgi:pyridoxal biosynthesis lyase PdxS